MKTNAFNAEVEQENLDAVRLDGIRRRAHAFLGEMEDLKSRLVPICSESICQAASQVTR